MNIPFLCVFLAFLLNYLSKIPLGMAMAQQARGYDNHHPREQQASLSGWGKRALGAHLNGFETFPGFAASVVIAHLAHVDPEKLSAICIIFLLSRVLYLYLYLADKATLRSLTWGIGGICITLNFIYALF